MAPPRLDTTFGSKHPRVSGQLSPEQSALLEEIRILRGDPAIKVRTVCDPFLDWWGVEVVDRNNHTLGQSWNEAAEDVDDALQAARPQ